MDLTSLEEKLNFRFKNKAFLRQALIHRSYLNENVEEKNSNERFEFLGDAILEFFVSEMLFQQFPQMNEGTLTALRSKLVCTKALAILARELEIGDFLFLSRGEIESGGRKNPTLLANAIEAVIGAIFLDSGAEKVSVFIKQQFTPRIAKLTPENLKDPKSLLQEKSQEREKVTPTYRIIGENGPDHSKTFTVGVYLEKNKIGEGKGPSKQEAEEAAAKAALKRYSAPEV